MTLTVEAKPPYTEDLVRGGKTGKRLYGAFRTYADGTKVYLAYRKHSEIYRGGEASISDAIRAGKAAWALDDETVLAARARGCRFVGVMVRDTGDVYLARIEKWFDRGRTRFINYEAKGGALQRCLGLSEFSFKPGEIKL